MHITTHALAHAHPTMPCIHLVMMLAINFPTESDIPNSLLSLQDAVALREFVALAGGSPEQQLYEHHVVSGSHVEKPTDDVTTELLKLLQTSQENQDHI